jgi:hypothetical protein
MLGAARRRLTVAVVFVVVAAAPLVGARGQYLKEGQTVWGANLTQGDPAVRSANTSSEPLTLPLLPSFFSRGGPSARRVTVPPIPTSPK